ncbi:unnamed protein product, partial [Prorocentrum cordatum]
MARQRTPPRGSTPPRKLLRSEAAPGPQVVYSPGKQLEADGRLHDADAEVRHMLRHKGHSEEDIRRIMSHTAPGTVDERHQEQAQLGAAEAGPARARRGGSPPARRFADHARLLGGRGVAAVGAVADSQEELRDALCSSAPSAPPTQRPAPPLLFDGGAPSPGSPSRAPPVRATGGRTLGSGGKA